MKTLHYAGFDPRAHGFGWATCNANLRDALLHHFDPGGDFSDVVFMPLADHDFNPASPARGKINIAYSFFEFPLGPKAVENAAKYNLIFVGSTWCKERCAERGIRAEVLIQGVDHEIFRPETAKEKSLKMWNEIGTGLQSLNRPKEQFRIFSGGKFEWRKGQDLVIRAFAEFAKTHPDAHLVCSWFNPWIGLVDDALNRMGHHSFRIPHSWADLFSDVLIQQGIPRDRFTILPQLSQPQLAAEMRNTDVGLFPNRCEGGTNLVLMEYAACGRPPVANTLTGHRDMQMLGAIPFPIPATVNNETGWAEQRIDHIIMALDNAYEYHRKGWAWNHVPTWEAAAQKVANAVERIAGTK